MLFSLLLAIFSNPAGISEPLVIPAPLEVDAVFVPAAHEGAIVAGPAAPGERAFAR